MNATRLIPSARPTSEISLTAMKTGTGWRDRALFRTRPPGSPIFIPRPSLAADRGEVQVPDRAELDAGQAGTGHDRLAGEDQRVDGRVEVQLLLQRDEGRAARTV